MVFGRQPLAKRGQGHGYERFFKLFPFRQICRNGKKPSSHFKAFGAGGVAVLLGSGGGFQP
jgi:hypothetical protein